MQKSIRVEVLGKEYALRVEEENEGRMRDVAKQVDGFMREFESAHPEQPRLTAAVIAALSIADKLRETRNENEAEEENRREEIQQMCRQLEAVLHQDE